MNSLFGGLNKVLNDNTINGINKSIANLSETIINIRKTIEAVNSMVADNQENLKITIENTRNITANFSKVSENINAVDFKKIIDKADEAVGNFNEMSKKINAGEGTLGQLLNDKRMYDNLEAATGELEQLLRDIKLNPKRYIHFSVFGKRQLPYAEKTKN